MKTIAIIGAGQLGSRHLQALAAVDFPITVQVVDPSSDALKIAKERFEQEMPATNVKQLTFHNSLDELYSILDFCIIATNADIRGVIIEKLLLKKEVKYLILEKILFQTEHEYGKIEELIQKHNVKTWVNCPRRMWPVYRDLREKFMNNRILEMNIAGSNWGMATSTIHMIDLLAFLTGNDDYNVSYDYLDHDVLESKRKGFVEFTGALKGMFKDGSFFNVSSYRSGSVPTIIELISEKHIFVIREFCGHGLDFRRDGQWMPEEFSFETPFQSKLSRLFIKQIIETGSCDLTSFEESVKLHKPMLNCFMSFLKSRGVEVDKCPVT